MNTRRRAGAVLDMRGFNRPALRAALAKGPYGVISDQPVRARQVRGE